MKWFVLIACLFCTSCVLETGGSYVGPPRQGVIVIEASPRPVSVMPRQADALIPMRQQEVKKPVVTERRMTVRVTAYCPCERWTPGKGVTANGGNAWKPGIAADWSFLPEGSLVSVPDYGTFMVDDKGGLLKRKYWKNGMPIIDIRMTYHWQARQWGTKIVDIVIIRLGYPQ